MPPRPTLPLPDRDRFATVQSLRFVAALLVVVYHANLFVQTHEISAKTLIDQASLDRIASIGRSGVHIFFVISGFIILHVSRDRFGQPGAVVRFALNRAARIYPLYWLMLVLWLAVSTQLFASLPSSQLRWIGVLFLWPSEADKIISVAWTLAFEMYFYAVFALALLLPRGLGLAFVAAVLLSGVAIGKLGNLSPATPAAEAPYGAELVLFLAGMAIALLLPRIRSQSLRWRALYGRLVVLAACVLLAASPWTRALGAPAVIAYGPAAILLVASAVFTDAAGLTSRLSHRLAPLGDSSYALYLAHIPIMILATPTLAEWAVALGLGKVPLLTALAVVSVVLSHMIHLVCERPLQHWLRRLIAPRPILQR